MAIGSPVPHRDGYLLLEIIVYVLVGPPILYALLWIVGEAVEHFTP